MAPVVRVRSLLTLARSVVAGLVAHMSVGPTWRSPGSLVYL